MKLVSSAEWAITRKDFYEIWNTKMVRATLILMPLLMVVLLPSFYLVLIYLVPTTQINGVEQMLRLLPSNLRNYSIQQSMYYLMNNMVCPMFFLMIPLMSATSSASCSFVGEKERGTMETLLFMPLKARQIFKAKVLCCTILSLLVTAISFVAFCIVTAIGNILMRMPFFFNWNWLILVFFLTPALTVFGVIFMVLASGRSKSYMEAFQTSGYVVLPIVLLFVGQFTGLFQLNALILLCISIAFMLVDITLWFFASRSFVPEKLIER